MDRKYYDFPEKKKEFLEELTENINSVLEFWKNNIGLFEAEDLDWLDNVVESMRLKLKFKGEVKNASNK